MSGDDKNMDEILGDIREAVSGEDGKREVRRPPMIGYTGGLFSVIPFVALAVIWERTLAGWLGVATDREDLSFYILLFFLIINVENIFRRPRGRGDWALVMATLFLATHACATASTIMSWLLENAAPDLNGILEAALIALPAVGALFAALWLASLLTRSRNLVWPREESLDGGTP